MLGEYQWMIYDCYLFSLIIARLINLGNEVIVESFEQNTQNSTSNLFVQYFAQ